MARLHDGASTPGGVLQLMDSSGSGTITCMGSSGRITCVSLTQTSLEETKKNFELYKNAIDEIVKTDIYEYNLKNEANDDKKHIGIVIGENYNYSDKITSLDEDDKENGVDLYSMISIAWQAIKEQQEIINKLENRIKKLEEGEENE